MNELAADYFNRFLKCFRIYSEFLQRVRMARNTKRCYSVLAFHESLTVINNTRGMLESATAFSVLNECQCPRILVR